MGSGGDNVGFLALLLFRTRPPHRVSIRATVKLSAAFLHDESSITKGGLESAIAPGFLQQHHSHLVQNQGYVHII